ncbi:MAG: S-layer homology domain-containing protein [Oscillospiraceae bacterium]|nr:S-layer homology domain-containing protein [Oscillospiraceae bacterium]
MKKQLQRILACLALCAVLAGSLAAPVSAAGFQDVPSSHWAAEEIRRCVELGFFNGESATRFGLGHEMTRSAFAVVLCRFFGWETPAPVQATYRDVPVTAWYAGAVQAAYAHGALTDQREDFRPADPITREELAVMLVRALGYGTIAGLAQDLPTPFRDVNTNAGYITMACDLGLMGGTSDTAFSPEKTAPREQVAVILMRLYDKLHRAAPGRVAILSSAEGAADLTGLDAAAISAGKLMTAGKAKVVSTMDAESAAALQAAARQAGAKTLLYVVGGPTALNGSVSETAAVLAEAVTGGGYDGVFLDIPQLKNDKQYALVKLVKALRPALGDKLLYLMAEAPAWQGTAYKGYDYAALGTYADRLVLRIASYEKAGGAFPTAPVDPLEEVYYALGTLRDTVDAGKLSLMVTAAGSAWTAGKKSAALSGADITALLAEEKTVSYYSDRYACAYLSGFTEDDKPLAVWYLDRQAAAERTQMARFFGVDQVCLSDLGDASAELLAGLY